MQEATEIVKGSRTMTRHLTAVMRGTSVEIEGDKARVRLGHKSGSHKFKFQLDDQTGLNVRFADLGVEVGEVCPENPGNNSGGQITDVDIDDDKAEFTDQNTGGPVTLGYTWFFKCNDPSQTPKFDPIIDNDGDDP